MKLAVVVAIVMMSGVAHAGPRRGMRAQLVERFDANHDGRLEKRERKQAARALRRLAKRLERGGNRQGRKQALIHRYDLNRDGDVGPGEMPPALAKRLRPLDENGDGWLTNGELR